PTIKFNTMKKYASFTTPLATTLFLFAFVAALAVSHTPNTTETDFVKQLKEKFRTFYQTATEDRVYVHTDKTFYQAGETIWFTAYLRDGETLKPSGNSDIIHVELITPKGSVAKQYKLVVNNGTARGDFDL